MGLKNLKVQELNNQELRTINEGHDDTAYESRSLKINLIRVSI